MSDKPLWRRRYPRIASNHTLLVKKLGSGSVEEFARTKTLAVGGCCFISSETFGEGALLELLIAVEQSVINARGRVVYEKTLEDGRNEVGVEFIDLDDANAQAIQRVFEYPAAETQA